MHLQLQLSAAGLHGAELQNKSQPVVKDRVRRGSFALPRCDLCAAPEYQDWGGNFVTSNTQLVRRY